MCLPFIYVLGYPVGYESELVLFSFEPQYAYFAHLCNCCEEKINTIVCKCEQLWWLSPQKNGGFYPRHPVSLLCVLLQLCPGSTGALSCLKNMLQYNLGCSWSSPQSPAAQSHCPLALRDYLLLKNTSQTAAQGACRQAFCNDTAPLIASL